MPVFTDYDVDLLNYELEELGGWVNSVGRLHITEEEFALGWVQPEHLQVLTEALKLVSISQSSFDTTVTTVSGDSVVNVELPSSLSFIRPDYARGGMVGSAPAEIRQKVTDWLEERLRVGRMLSHVSEGLYHLNRTCSNVRSMALMLPCLPSLMSSAGKKEPARSRIPKLLQQLPKQKAGRFPQLPVDVKQALAEASALVTGLVLMRTDAPVSQMHTPAPKGPDGRRMVALCIKHVRGLAKHRSIFGGHEISRL